MADMTKIQFNRLMRALVDMLGAITFGALGSCMLFIKPVENVTNWPFIGTFFILACIRFMRGFYVTLEDV